MMGMKQSSWMLVLPVVPTHRPARAGGRRKRRALWPKNARAPRGVPLGRGAHRGCPHNPQPNGPSMRVSPVLGSSTSSRGAVATAEQWEPSRARRAILEQPQMKFLRADLRSNRGRSGKSRSASPAPAFGRCTGLRIAAARPSISVEGLARSAAASRKLTKCP